MRSVAGWMGAVFLVVGCSVPSDVAKTCSSNADCAQFDALCNTDLGLCYTEPIATGCTPACVAYEVCTTGGCKPRYTALNILSPSANAALDGGTVLVSAQLVSNRNYEDPIQLPETLSFRAERGGGGDFGSFGSVTRSGDVYTVPWTPTAAQEQVTLIATHPDPAAGLWDTVNVTVDAVPPTLTMAFSAPPTRDGGSSTHANEIDPATGYQAAFRRDESVTVNVSASESMSNVSLTVVGIGPNETDGQALPPIPVQPGGTTCGGSPPFCGTVTVDLSKPEMSAFRGSMGFRVEGQDTVGNSGAASGGLRVTRWKWAFNGAGPIKASPAIGEKGYVYFGTASINGRMFAIEPSGNRKWELPVEAVESSPAVGAFTNGTELVYVASNFSAVPDIGAGTRIRAINGIAGTVLNAPTCTFSELTGTPPAVISAGAITETRIGSTPIETGLFVVSGSQRSAVGVRPASAGSATMACVNSDTSQIMPSANVNGGLVATSTGQFAYATDTRHFVKYAFGSPTALWDAVSAGVQQPIFGIALLGNTLLAGGGRDFNEGGIFQVAFGSTGMLTINALPGTENGRVYQVVGSADGKLYYGRESADLNTQLVRYNLPGPSVAQSVSGPGVIAAAPVLGSDGKLYTVSRTGEVTAWTAADLVTSSQQWKLPSVGANVEASPTLDCARSADGTPLGANFPGVLYVAAGNKLHAFVVDSPRMPKEANSWPKFQHDARNTGNPATPITNCP